MGKRTRYGRSSFSLPLCILFVLAVAIIAHTFSSFKQTESESKLKEEVKALSEEFGLDFSVTLAELVKRGMISPTLAASLIKGEGESEGTIELFKTTQTNAEEDELKAEQEDTKEIEVDGSAESKPASFFEDAAKWMKPDEKYFVYQSSGGLSNQRIMLEYALIVGRYLNRTVILPGLGPHTSMWYNFNKIPLEDFLPADELLDFNAMNAFAKVLPIRGITLKRFIMVNENPKTWYRVERNKLAEKRQNPWSLEYVQNTFGNLKDPVLFFARGTMWECFDFSSEVLDAARRSVRAHLSIRKVARNVALRLFPKGHNALHTRFMDGDGTDLREGLLKPAPSFIFRMRKFDKTIPLYVATVPAKRKSPYFNAFKEKFKLVFGDALERDPEVQQILAGITRRMKETVLGIIEQLVCARAERFLGTGFSTFSEHIRRMRRWRELTAVTDLTDPEDIKKEQKFLDTVTPCIGPLTPC